MGRDDVLLPTPYSRDSAEQITSSVLIDVNCFRWLRGVPPNSIKIISASVFDASVMQAILAQHFGSWTSALAIAPSPDAVEIESVEKRQISSADQVQLLHSESGLTWAQIARIVGVSRRSVHSWAAGARISSHHLESISTLLSRVRSIVAGSAEERRAEIFRVSNKSSYFERWLEEFSGGNVNLSESAFKLSYIEGAVHGKQES